MTNAPRLALSILSLNPLDYRDRVKEAVDAGVEVVHFDVMDGQFVPPITFGAGVVEALAREVGSQATMEVHLMTNTPEAHFRTFRDAGAERIQFHVEASIHAHRHLQQIRELGAEACLALNPATPAVLLEPLREVLDQALIMTVNPGWGGQPLIEACVRKIAEVRQMMPDLDIEVDGGVDANTITRLHEAGATTFVTGSYLAKHSPMAPAVTALREACASKR